MELLTFFSFFLGMAWDFFTEINVPGCDFTFGALFVGLFLASLGLRFLRGMLGMGISSGTVTGILRHGDRKDD